MESIENQFQYWDKVSATKNFTHPIEIEKVKPYLSKTSRILDYGCGYGRTCNELYKLGYNNIVGFDSSQKMIRRGLKEHPHLELTFLSEDISESNQFDAIILFAVLTCIPTNSGQQELIRKLRDILSPNGILYISDYWLQANDRNINRYNENEKKYGQYGVFELPEGAIVRHHSKEWIDMLLNGFEAKEYYDCELTSMNGNQSRCFQFIGKNQ